MSKETRPSVILLSFVRFPTFKSCASICILDLMSLFYVSQQSIRCGNVSHDPIFLS